MAMFGGGDNGDINLNIGELRAFQQKLTNHANSLRQLDRDLKDALDKLGNSYRDGSYYTFRTHVESAVFKQHQEELTRVEAMVKSLNDSIIQIEIAKNRLRRSMS